MEESKVKQITFHILIVNNWTGCGGHAIAPNMKSCYIFTFTFFFFGFLFAFLCADRKP